MSLKQILESNIVIVVSVVAISASGIGWGACEAIRVSNKTDKIAELEKRNTELSQQIKNEAATLEPYQRQIGELISNTKRLEAEASSAKRLEADLSNTQGNLAQWQQALQSWKAANAQLQSDLNLCSTNAAVVGLVRAVEGKKEAVERELEEEIRWHANSLQGDEYKRRIAEHQARLVSLQEKLVCVRR